MEIFYKRREELRDIQREINWLQEDLEDLLEKLEEEEEEYRMQFGEDKKIPPLTKTETEVDIVDFSKRIAELRKRIEEKDQAKPSHLVTKPWRHTLFLFLLGTETSAPAYALSILTL